MDSLAFEQLVEEALGALEQVFPDVFLNVAVCVEDRPGRKTRQSVGLLRGETLCGLYEGVARTERSYDEPWMFPDKITLFRLPILEEAEIEGRPVRDVIRDVVWHEVAHALGLDEARARASEERRQSK